MFLEHLIKWNLDYEKNSIVFKSFSLNVQSEVCTVIVSRKYILFPKEADFIV